MKKTLILMTAAGLALGACQENIGEKVAETASPSQYAGKTCGELKTLLNEYENAGDVLSSNDDPNSAQAVVGTLAAASGAAPVAGATMAASAIRQDQKEQQVREAGNAQVAAIKEAGRQQGCW